GPKCRVARPRPKCSPAAIRGGLFMTASSTALRALDAEDFAPQHRWDRNVFLLLVGLIWFGVLMGFGGDIARHVRAHEPPYPLIVHFHAFVMVSWLVLLTAQVLLI